MLERNTSSGNLLGTKCISHSFSFPLQLKRKSSTVECVKVGVSFKVEAVEVRGVDVLAAGVEGAACRELGEASRAVRQVWGSGGQGGGGGAGAEVAQGGGGRCPSHQQTHRPHRPGVAAVAVAKAV